MKQINKKPTALITDTIINPFGLFVPSNTYDNAINNKSPTVHNSIFMSIAFILGIENFIITVKTVRNKATAAAINNIKA
ncbi:MAG: hypothetical protein PUB67_03085 [Clostridiales bacterium]|nr:hypothetical protein [Clostridiales bacterium]